MPCLPTHQYSLVLVYAHPGFADAHACFMCLLCSAVEFHLDKLCGMLLTGEPGPKAEDDEAAAVGAAALAFFRNRASAPRDMSAAATVQFRAACDAVLAHVY